MPSPPLCNPISPRARSPVAASVDGRGRRHRRAADAPPPTRPPRARRARLSVNRRCRISATTTGGDAAPAAAAAASEAHSTSAGSPRLTTKVDHPVADRPGAVACWGVRSLLRGRQPLVDRVRRRTGHGPVRRVPKVEAVLAAPLGGASGPVSFLRTGDREQVDGAARREGSLGMDVALKPARSEKSPFAQCSITSDHAAIAALCPTAAASPTPSTTIPARWASGGGPGGDGGGDGGGLTAIASSATAFAGGSGGGGSRSGAKVTCTCCPVARVAASASAHGPSTRMQPLVGGRRFPRLREEEAAAAFS